tara:strand:+ start:1644 stop:1934 length:291 start_codon:yes stop_codon:yes gene_type:complete
MSKSTVGITREDGAETSTFEVGKQYKSTSEWQEKIFNSFVDLGLACEIGDNAPVLENKMNRARNNKGQLVGDDPKTPNVNEAWDSGTAPKKKAKKS